jgi:hypothetical protein
MPSASRLSAAANGGFAHDVASFCCRNDPYAFHAAPPGDVTWQSLQPAVVDVELGYRAANAFWHA